MPDKPARWFKDKTEIFPTEECQLKVEGTVHTLTIPRATLEDEAEYTICIGDKTSTALLLVEGKSSFLYHFIILHKQFDAN